MSTPKSADINRLLNVILNADHFVKASHCQNKKMNPLSVIQLKSLIFIQQSKQATVKALADYLQVTPPTASVMVSHLTDSKLVARAEDKNDRRIIHLKITPAGHQKIKETISLLVKKIQLAFAKLNQTEIEQFISIIEKITQTNQK